MKKNYFWSFGLLLGLGLFAGCAGKNTSSSSVQSGGGSSVGMLSSSVVTSSHGVGTSSVNSAMQSSMSSASSRTSAASALSSASVRASSSLVSSLASSSSQVVSSSSASLSSGCHAESLFKSYVSHSVIPVCQNCHKVDGIARGTRLLFEAENIDSNFLKIKNYLSLDANISAIFMDKPAARVAHGGGRIYMPGSTEDLAMQALVAAIKNDPASCGVSSSSAAAVEVNDWSITLDMAAMILVGRKPHDTERSLLRSFSQRGDEAGFDMALDAIMLDEAFYQTIKSMFNDLLNTNEFRFGNGQNLVGTLPQQRADATPEIVLSLPYCSPSNWQNYLERNMTDSARDCIYAADALAREPLEYIAHVVKNDRNFGEILYGQYRLLNLYSAKVFGLDTSIFPSANPDHFVEFKVDSMHAPLGLEDDYAGIITTNAFLTKHGSTSTNRNRSRAYHYLKYFMDYDVMDNVERLDLSGLNLSEKPWLTNVQCTGCHQWIDPIAGLFQHWTHCYDGNLVTYFPVRYCQGDWYPESDMLAPGFGPSLSDRASTQDLDTGLKLLGERTARTKSFSRAISKQVYRYLMGRDLLKMPSSSEEDYDEKMKSFDRESHVIESISLAFMSSNNNLKSLIKSVIKSDPFRAVVFQQHEDNRIAALGHAALLNPETLNAKVKSLFGATWNAGISALPLSDPADYLLSYSKLHLFSGGLDSINIEKRGQLATAPRLSVYERMALDMSCRHVAFDFSLPQMGRRLFDSINLDIHPARELSPEQTQLIYTQLERLIKKFWIVSDSDFKSDTEFMYSLLRDIATVGRQAVASRVVPSTLEPSCAGRVNPLTGASVSGDVISLEDPDYTVRSWQAVIAYLMMDPKFYFLN
jgi:hypothetical protein